MDAQVHKAVAKHMEHAVRVEVFAEAFDEMRLRVARMVGGEPLPLLRLGRSHERDCRSGKERRFRAEVTGTAFNISAMVNEALYYGALEFTLAVVSTHCIYPSALFPQHP